MEGGQGKCNEDAIERDAADIASIALYIAADNPSAARRWLDDIDLRCRNLGEMPGLGVAPRDARRDLRMFPVGNYLILYRPIEVGVEIVRVLHGARRWRDLL